MRTFQRNILRYICNLPVVPKCERIFNQRLFPKREESWLCFFNSVSLYIWLGLQSSLILSHVTIHYGEASGKETNKRFQADLATISFPGIIWESTFVVFLFWQIGLILNSHFHSQHCIWTRTSGSLSSVVCI